jgi:hypothetical protein
MEATGGYEAALACALQAAGLRLARPVTRPSIEAILEAIARQLDEVDVEMLHHVEQHHAVMASCCRVSSASVASPQPR